jgi:hypothetical protein
VSFFGSLGSVFGINKQTVGSLKNVGIGLLTGGPAGAATAMLGEIASKAGGAAPAAKYSSPQVNMGSVGTAVSRLIGGPGSGPQSFPTLPGVGQIPVQIDSTRTSGVSLFPGGPMVGTQTTYTSPAGGAGHACPVGYHWNRTGYYTRQGFVAKGTKCVKNRRRNPLNPRALSRSMSRIHSAKKAAHFLDRIQIGPRRRKRA